MTHNISQIKGAITALVTPFSDDFSVDYGALGDLIDWQIESGIHALSVTGTTGETSTLTNEEHKEIISFAVKRINGRVPLIAGTGSNSTQEAIELTQHAKDAGADVVLSVTPYYNKPSQEGLYRHFCTISNSVDIPIMLYEVPSRCVISLDHETVVKISSNANIIGLKDASESMDKLMMLRLLLGDEFILLSGNDKNSVAFNLAGGNGCVSVVSNCVPKLFAEMQNTSLSSHFDKAIALNSKLSPLIDAFDRVATNPIPIKYALNRITKCKNVLRLPMTSLDEAHYSTVDEALRKINLI